MSFKAQNDRFICKFGTSTSQLQKQEKLAKLRDLSKQGYKKYLTLYYLGWHPRLMNNMFVKLYKVLRFRSKMCFDNLIDMEELNDMDMIYEFFEKTKYLKIENEYFKFHNYHFMMVLFYDILEQIYCLDSWGLFRTLDLKTSEIFLKNFFGMFGSMKSCEDQQDLKDSFSKNQLVEFILNQHSLIKGYLFLEKLVWMNPDLYQELKTEPGFKNVLLEYKKFKGKSITMKTVVGKKIWKERKIFLSKKKKLEMWNDFESKKERLLLDNFNAQAYKKEKEIKRVFGTHEYLRQNPFAVFWKMNKLTVINRGLVNWMDILIKLENQKLRNSLIDKGIKSGPKSFSIRHSNALQTQKQMILSKIDHHHNVVDWTLVYEIMGLQKTNKLERREGIKDIKLNFLKDYLFQICMEITLLGRSEDNKTQFHCNCLKLLVKCINNTLFYKEVKGYDFTVKEDLLKDYSRYDDNKLEIENVSVDKCTKPELLEQIQLKVFRENKVCKMCKTRINPEQYTLEQSQLLPHLFLLRNRNYDTEKSVTFKKWMALVMYSIESNWYQRNFNVY